MSKDKPTKMEQAIKVMARLYECRDAAKSFARLTKKPYIETLKPYMHIVEQVMKANRVDHLDALLIISKTQTYQEEGMAQMKFMAAVVELMEPSEPHFQT